MHNCSELRSGISLQTNTENKEVQTVTLTIKSRPLASGLVKAKTRNSTKASVYNDWYKKVYKLDVVGGYEEEGDTGGGITPGTES